jgi:lipid kinase, YegS/Rv2252/BmrU family
MASEAPVPVGTGTKAAPLPTPYPVTLIYNPGAGQGGAGASVDSEPLWLNEAATLLRVATGRDPLLIAATHFEQAAEAAREAATGGAPLVLAGGGDGTVRAVAEGLAETGTPLGLLPRGTVNVLARELAIPLDNLPAALDIALHGETRHLDLGRCGSRYFLLMASVGIDASAVKNVNTHLKGVVGGGAYVVAGLSALASFSPPRFTVRLGREETVYWEGEAFTIVIANTKAYGGDFQLAPEAVMDDGKFDVVIFGVPRGSLPFQRANFLLQVGAVALNRHRNDPDIQYFRSAQVVVESAEPAPVQIDGDALGTTPLRVEVAPRALTVRVPHPAHIAPLITE